MKVDRPPRQPPAHEATKPTELTKRLVVDAVQNLSGVRRHWASARRSPGMPTSWEVNATVPNKPKRYASELAYRHERSTLKAKHSASGCPIVENFHREVNHVKHIYAFLRNS